MLDGPSTLGKKGCKVLLPGKYKWRSLECSRRGQAAGAWLGRRPGLGAKAWEVVNTRRLPLSGVTHWGCKKLPTTPAGKAEQTPCPKDRGLVVCG